KGVRECRSRPLYHIKNYMNRDGLSSSYQAFTEEINSTSILNSIQEAIAILELKKAINEE
ncbi:unnamed protein product, partial [Dovyalis caffra]